MQERRDVIPASNRRLVHLLGIKRDGQVRGSHGQQKEISLEYIAEESCMIGRAQSGNERL